VRERVFIDSTSLATGVRPRVGGKFLFLGEDKLYVRGVTYGTFRPDERGHQYGDPGCVERDFAQMAASGVNAVRTYTVPPRWLLDIAKRCGLHVMVGLPWEGHVAFLDDRKRTRAIERKVRAGVRACAGHPAVLCYVIGNEIPASIVRWHGRRRIERFLERLYRTAKAEDPDGLVSYANYPSTEYLRLPFVDLFCANLYLEEQGSFGAYLARLHNLAEDRPVIMTEIGLDSRRHGTQSQASTIDWQIRTAFAAGCAGVFVFSWTDEWYTGGYDVTDWDFGLTTRKRDPKAALAAARAAFAEVPFPEDLPWPRISVVVCSRNGERTIGECLDGLLGLHYQDYEVIVVDDGSTDATAAIAGEYDVRLISTENRGLSEARNTGMEVSTGEIVAYTDDDTRPDPHWLSYLAAGFLLSEHAGIGGPNVAFRDDGLVAECVASAPGNPAHVLLSDTEAEHIPGCNMAFRKDHLEAVGGFDPRFRVAGDDADLCWRIREKGWTLGFAPAAMVWHHRRGSLRAYWRQQKGYGKADAMLARKWPKKYNAVGNLRWEGRIYSRGTSNGSGWRRGRIFHGTWGTALFQSVYQPGPDVLAKLLLTPEWHLFGITLLALLALGADWLPALFAVPLLLCVVMAPSFQAFAGAAEASCSMANRPYLARLALLCVTAYLHLLQPLARLHGRFASFATHRASWHAVGARDLSLPRSRSVSLWSERWKPPEARLESVETGLWKMGATPIRGGDFDRWDLEVRAGRLGGARLQMAVEEHGGGKQLVRFRARPRYSIEGLIAISLLVAVAAGAAWNGAWGDTMVLATICAVLVLRLLSEGARAMSAFVAIVKGLPEDVFVVHRTSGRSKGRETPKRDKASEGSETP
jgi:O-antigen biosynthesis protein